METSNREKYNKLRFDAISKLTNFESEIEEKKFTSFYNLCPLKIYFSYSC